MSYQVAGLMDQVGSFLSGGIGGVGAQVAAGAAPELKNAVVAAVNEVLPKVQVALSKALSEGAANIGRQNKAALITMGTALGLFTIGTLGLLFFQYRRLGKCCPTR